MPKPTASSKTPQPKLVDIFYQCAENMVADLHAEVMKMFDDQDDELCKEYGIDQTYAQQDSTSFDQDVAVLGPYVPFFSFLRNLIFPLFSDDFFLMQISILKQRNGGRPHRISRGHYRSNHAAVRGHIGKNTKNRSRRKRPK